MPESTPIFGFPYPCEDEQITVASFANLANSIDIKLAQLQADEFEALNRYSAGGSSDILAVAAGVDTVMTGADATYTIPAAGVWLLQATTFTVVNPATSTSTRLRVRKNGVVQFGTRQNPENGIFDFMAVGFIVAAAGDVISYQILYSGTGTWTVAAGWEASMFIRIP